MTDSEITIKALKELLEVVLSEGDLQRTSTISHTIDLINRLQAENERLTNNVITLTKSISELTNEVERQRRDKDDAFKLAADIVDAEKTVTMKTKAEAYKEFAERLKKHSYYDHKDQRNVVAEVIIDHYLKELEEK